MAENTDAPIPGVPPEVAAILRLAEQPGEADDGDMSGSTARPAPEQASRAEPRQRDAKAAYRYRVYEVEPTFHNAMLLPLSSWQMAHRKTHGHLPEEVQVSLCLAEALWRDFSEAVRRGDAERYDPLGMSFEEIAAAMRRAEAPEEELGADFSAYREGLLESGREGVRQGMTLAQFLDLVESGEARA